MKLADMDFKIAVINFMKVHTDLNENMSLVRGE